jgi:hypothetical protein
MHQKLPPQTQYTSVNKLPTINRKSKNERNQYSKLVGHEYHLRPKICKSNPHLAIKCFASNFFLTFLALHFFLTFTQRKEATSIHHLNSMRQLIQLTPTLTNLPLCLTRKDQFPIISLLKLKNSTHIFLTPRGHNQAGF